MLNQLQGQSESMAVVARQIRSRAAAGNIVFVSGNFNILHPGHLRLLRFAGELGGRLVVGVNDDSTDGVTVPQTMRLQGVKALGAVHEAVALTEPCESFIARLQPEIVVKGKEYAGAINPEQPIVEAYGGKILFSSGEVRFSSLDLLQRDYAVLETAAIHKPLDYTHRNGFHTTDLAAIPPKFRDLKVVVVGDLIVDQYINCDPLGMSREDPTIVVTPVESKRFVGGAGIVAAHARGLGASVRYIGAAGQDEAGEFARTELRALGVAADILPDPTRPTTLKQRYRASGKTLLRVNHLRQHSIEASQQKRLLAAAEAALADADVLLFSDFNYGCLPQPVVDRLTQIASERGIMMGADSQASSQLADISRFKGMHLLTPTEHEARLALRDNEAGLIVIANRLHQVAQAKHVVITLGGEGLLIHAEQEGGYRTDRLPAFNLAPKDVAGAGDSFLTCASMALGTGANIWQAAYLGSLAAACQVGRVGNTPLTAAELLAELANTSNLDG